MGEPRKPVGATRVGALSPSRRLAHLAVSLFQDLELRSAENATVRYAKHTLEGDEIVHFRPSGNAPELRCYAEAATQERAGALVQACLQRLKSGLDV